MASIKRPARTRALIDADVLHRANVRDLLLRLARQGLFRPHWSTDILSELAISLSRRHLTTDQVDRLAQAMRTAFPDAELEGYQTLIPTLTLPDPDDVHVLAAAISGRCDVIVTCNAKDFPAAVLEPMGIVAQHPDSFIMELLHDQTAIVLATIRAQHIDLANPPIPFADFVAGLRAQGLSRIADLLG